MHERSVTGSRSRLFGFLGSIHGTNQLFTSTAAFIGHDQFGAATVQLGTAIATVQFFVHTIVAAGFVNGQLQSFHIHGFSWIFFQHKDQFALLVKDQDTTGHPSFAGLHIVGTVLDALFLVAFACPQNALEQGEESDIDIHGLVELPLVILINGVTAKIVLMKFQKALQVRTASIFDGRHEGNFGILCRKLGQLTTVLTASDSSGLTNGKDHRTIRLLGFALLLDGVHQ